MFFLCRLHYQKFDLVLMAVETIVTFSVAYRASVGLGTVLLQTSPEKGLATKSLVVTMELHVRPGLADYAVAFWDGEGGCEWEG